MIRLLRRILRLGLLAGVGVGILKVVRGRKAPDPWADSWVSTGPPGGTRPSLAPVPAAAAKPPAPAGTASAALATPPPASPQPPSPAGSASAAVATPPPASPQPPPPADKSDAKAGKSDAKAGKSDAKAGKSDGKAGKSKSGKSNGGKSAPSRTAKPTRKGPARKSPTGRAEEPPGERLWVQANEGVCPPTHPVKAKLSSKIFHTPTGRNYKSTKADRCYPDEASAQADGLRPAQR